MVASNQDRGNTDRLALFAADLQVLDIVLLPPDINASGVHFQQKNAIWR